MRNPFQIAILGCVLGAACGDPSLPGGPPARSLHAGQAGPAGPAVPTGPIDDDAAAIAEARRPGPPPADPPPRGLSPKRFEDGGHTYVPVDIEQEALLLSFDVATRTARGSAALRFHLEGRGRPVLLLDATVEGVKLNGRVVPHRHRVRDPDGFNALLAIDVDLPAGAPQELEIAYRLGAGAVRFDSQGVGFLTDMSDVDPVVYFERWGPVGFEDDHFALALDLELRGGVAAHRLFTNGTARRAPADRWHVDFPPYFTASSFYVHLTSLPLEARSVIHAGRERDILVTAYAPSGSLLSERAIGMLPGLFTELEADYGPYPHDHFVAYVVGSGGGGMEYAGATITSLRALSHELAHSWFARGVMPADGRSQWIDEGIVTWRDQRYPTAGALLAAAATNLGNHSPYMRGMPYYVHYDAARLMSEWQLLFGGSGGLKPLLRGFFTEHRLRSVTQEEFRAYLERETGVDLDPYFRRYVTGPPPMTVAPDSAGSVDGIGHPAPLSPDELRGLR